MKRETECKRVSPQEDTSAPSLRAQQTTALLCLYVWITSPFDIDHSFADPSEEATTIKVHISILLQIYMRVVSNHRTSSYLKDRFESNFTNHNSQY